LVSLDLLNFQSLFAPIHLNEIFLFNVFVELLFPAVHLRGVVKSGLFFLAGVRFVFRGDRGFTLQHLNVFKA